MEIRLPKKEEKRRIKLYKKELNDREIAEKAGTTRSNIHKWRKRRKLPPNTSPGGQEKDINVKPTKNWGYLLGLTLGDGYSYKTKQDNYVIGIESTKRELPDMFEKVAKQLIPNSIWRNNRIRERTLPNGEIRQDTHFYARISSSKQLFELINECKNGCEWWFPEFTKENLSAKTGFLQGIFDAEGSVDAREFVSRSYCSLSSSVTENLERVKTVLLEDYEISSQIYRKSGELETHENKKFYEKIGFRLFRKKRKLEEVIGWPNGHVVDLSAVPS